ncbi:MAG: PQQ-binding-like beta-propeller repeat protein [Porticoccaceae bacterium]|nr:PQQ-binding-like beta-propeller repeat protein [Porticoccaceae bacterium]
MMMKDKKPFKRLIASLLWVFAGFGGYAFGQQDPHRKGSTVNNISEDYALHCSSCHGKSLEGGFGGSLANQGFVDKWQQQGTKKLLHYVVASMPVGKEGSLTKAQYVSVVNDIIRKAELGDTFETSVVDNEAFWDDTTIEMDVDWVSKLPTNNDATAIAAAEHQSALLRSVSPVTQELLENPGDGDWLHWRRTYSGSGFSPLRQINKKNVAKLGVAWALALPAGTNAITPLVHDGVMFVNSNGTVRAIDALRGDILWQFSRSAERRMQSSQPKSMAISGSTLLVPTSDLHILALDIQTGKVLWDHAIEPEGTPYHLASGPLVVKDKIIQGVSGCYDASIAGGCFVVALDASTGAELWRFYTIAKPGEAGGDSWNGAPLERRSGGSVWSTASYDPELNLVYIGTSQTYHIAALIEEQENQGQSKDALYTNSTLAINPDTGELVWHYQHFPGDLWDLDWAFERSVLDLPTPDGTQKAVVTLGKIGILDALDAKTGEYLFSLDMGLQQLVDRIDPETGRKHAKEEFIPKADGTAFVCPSSLGVRSWPATAVDPETGVLYTPALEACMDVLYEPGKGVDTGWVHKPRPDSDGNIGGVYALDLKAKKITWQQRRRASGSSAILATAGGLVFEGTRDRWFRAFDNKTGKLLWDIRLDGVPSSFPISFAVDGKQFIAITAGGGNVHDTFWRPFTPEINSPADGTTLWVFAAGK